MLINNSIFIKLKFFTLFSEYFIGIMALYSLALFFLIVADFLKNYELTVFEYLLLLLFAGLGLVLLCCANDFVTAFLSIELISLCSFLLSAFKKISSYSLEAGIKYLIIGSISTSFFLLGSSLFYCYLGTVSLLDIKFLLIKFNKFCVFYKLFFSGDFYLFYCFKNLSLLFYQQYNLIIQFGIIFLMFSIFIKLGLAPFHFWSLDVYEGSPIISTFFFSNFTKLSFFVFLSRFIFVFTDFQQQFFVFIMIVVSTVSIVFGSFAGVKQKKIKTLLAYSSVSHMGYSLLTVSNFMILGLEMLYFYLLIYILSSTVVWCLIIGLKNNAGDYKAKATKNISDLVLLSKSNWFLAFGFSLSCLSLAGIPPLIGFIAKLNVFLILVVQNFQLLAFFVILCSAVSTFFYIRLIKVLYFEPSTIGRLYSFKFNYVLLFCSCIFCLIFLFVNPKLLYLEIHKMVLFENYNKFGFIFEDVSNFLLIFNLILAK